jgi:voltage-gated potassium channel
MNASAIPPPPTDFGKPSAGLRRRLYTIIFEADTPAGLRFDLFLIVAILASIVVVVLDSVQRLHVEHGRLMATLEWGFTLLFTAEYLLRLYCVEHRARYATSFFGVIDFLSILPTFIALFMPGMNMLLDVRILRLLRIFRILKLTLYVAEYSALLAALRASRRKILIFISVVVMLDLLLGTMMYVVEGPENGYTSIPVAMYWAIVTMTTVGYGDITPHTNPGKLIASAMMLLGWGILAVPTGIVTSEMTAQRFGGRLTARRCAACGSEGHERDAKFCKDCGAPFSLPASADNR